MRKVGSQVSKTRHSSRSEWYTPWNLVLFAARRFTPAELCDAHHDAIQAGEHHNARLYEEALSVQARRTTWGDVIEQTMNRTGGLNHV